MTLQSKYHIITLAAAMLLCLASCSLTRQTVASNDDGGYPSRTAPVVRRANNPHPTRRTMDDDNYDTPTQERNTAEQWKTLNINLTAGDNYALYDEVRSWLGTPYAGGGHTKQRGTDCSGFVMEVYKAVYNMNIERIGGRMLEYNCRRISKDQLREGDLVFFHPGNGSTVSHVGIYLKDNKFAHASSSRGVVIDDLNANYYLKHYLAAGRVIK